MESSELKTILEAALLSADQPLSLIQLVAIFDDETEVPEKKDIKECLEALNSDYEGRAMEVKLVGSGYRIQVVEKYAPWVSKLWQERPARYSRALMETLALVAYRQPVTRGEIEEVRGVSVSTNIIRTLLERDWVRVVGHREVPGRPSMYGTTKGFLDYFNIKSLDELPTLLEVRDLDVLARELNLELDIPPVEDPEEGLEAQGGTASEASAEADIEAGDQAVESGVPGGAVSESLADAEPVGSVH